MSNQGQNQLLPMFRDWVPEKLRIALLLLFPLLFLSSNPLYMNIAHHVMSDTGMMREDVLMCGFSSILGTTVTFPILFRLKFRFTSRQIFLIVPLGLITCSLTAMNCHFLPLTIFASFVFGMFKLWGAFECFSSMMPVVSPKMDLAPFLTMVFIIVFGGVELGGYGSTFVAHYFNWRYANHAMTGLLLLVALVSRVLMRDFRFRPPMKLYGIDWLGMVLWAIFLLSLTFVCIYGEYLDWFSSPVTCVALATSLFALAANILRMTNIHHPYIEAKCFRYKNTWNILIIFFLSGIMFSSQNVMQNILTESVLQFDDLHVVNLNWFVWAGIIAGAFLSKWGLMQLGWGYKQLTFACFLFASMYAASMYSLVSTHTNLGAFCLPAFLSGIGHVMIFVVLTTYIESKATFNHRPQLLAVLGLVRTGIATPIGNALWGHLFRVEMGTNLSLLGSSINQSAVANYSQTVVMESLATQATTMSLQSLYGLTTIIGITTMLIILLSRFKGGHYRLKYID